MKLWYLSHIHLIGANQSSFNVQPIASGLFCITHICCTQSENFINSSCVLLMNRKNRDVQIKRSVNRTLIWQYLSTLSNSSAYRTPVRGPDEAYQPDPPHQWVRWINISYFPVSSMQPVSGLSKCCTSHRDASLTCSKRAAKSPEAIVQNGFKELRTRLPLSNLLLHSTSCTDFNNLDIPTTLHKATWKF